HEDHDANDNSQTSPMNTTTTHPTNVINTYTTNSTNSFRMSTTTQPLNMANSQPLNTSIPPVTSAALAQHNGAPGNRPGVKVRADLFPGAELWHLTYSTPPFQNVPVPTDSWTVLSGV